jgi:hypothetical protein
VALPFTLGLDHRGDAVAHRVEDLRPDNPEIRHRHRLRRRLRARRDDAFDLRSAVGGAHWCRPPGATRTTRLLKPPQA